jgi:hypothetical protein
VTYLDDLSPEEAASRQRGRKRAKTGERPEPDRFSELPLVRAWQEWDLRPGDPETAGGFAAELAAWSLRTGEPVIGLHDRLVAALAGLASETAVTPSGYYAWSCEARERAFRTVEDSLGIGPKTLDTAPRGA